MTWYGILCIVFAAIAAFVFGFAFYAYSAAFYSPRKRRINDHELPEGIQYEKLSSRMHELIDEVLSIPREEIEILSYDGLKLRAGYYHTADGAPVLIMFHGYRGTARRDFSGGIKLAIKNGFNVILVDQRAHGESEGNTICFGVKEKYDVLSWVNYTVERFGKDVKICLSGISMGAATVLESTALELPENVKCVIADSPYSSAKEIIKIVCAQMKVPVWVTYPFVLLGGKIYGHLNLSGGAESAVKRAKIPVLLLHGEADTFVPPEMSKRIYDACASEKFLYLFPDAGHGLEYLVDKEGYEKAVSEFLKGTV